MTKPFDMDDFLTRLAELCDPREQRRASAVLGVSRQMREIEAAPAARGRACGFDGADHRRNRRRQGGVPRASSTRPRARRNDRSSPSIARRSRPTCWRASCSGTRRAPSRAPSSGISATPSGPARASCSSTRSASCALQLQAKLLRLIEDRAFSSRRRRAADVRSAARLVARPTPISKRRVAQGRFREDLSTGSTSSPFAIPPLRERPDDIAWLMDNASSRSSPDARGSAHGHQRARRGGGLAHAWPGNVRELRNRMERAVALGLGHGSCRATFSRTRRIAAPASRPTSVARGSTQSAERRQIQRALGADRRRTSARGAAARVSPHDPVGEDASPRDQSDA